MTSFDAQHERAVKIVDQVITLLDETLLAQQIDEPIDRALQTFGCELDRPNGPRHFHEIVGRFVGHVYEQALACPRRLSLDRACDEALALLDEGYQNPHANGYCAARLDAVDPQAGMQLVLARLADLIKTRQRQMRIRGALAWHIDWSDWQLKCQIASILLDRCRPFLPPDVRGCEPDRFADDLPELFGTALSGTLLRPQITADLAASSI